MADVFSFECSPFNALGAVEQAQVAEAATLQTLVTGQTLTTAHSPPEQVWVVHSGHVQQEDDGHVHVLEAGESIGWRALLTGCKPTSTTALDATQLWQLPKAILMRLLADNPRFNGQVLTELARNLTADADQEHQREMMSLMLVRVKDAYLKKPLYVAGDLDLVSVCRILSENKMTFALVRDTQAGTERIGMFTTTDLRDALLNSVAVSAIPVRAVAKFDLISLDADAELFDALLMMLRHRVHRVLVKDGDTILGVLTQLDLMSFMSNHSHLITLQVEQAHTVAELQVVAHQVDGAIKMLQRGGMRIEIICKLVSELNAQIFTRLWALLAPPDLQRNSCLLVMGSEGRGEQILKTDQDNALLLRDGYVCDALPGITEQFSAALLSFGYPPCPGNIMVTNPLWCQSVAGFRQTLGDWLFGGAAEGSMNLAIFLDARVVCGDATLLANVRDHALRLATGSSTYLGRMASAIDQFKEPATGWWGRLTHLQVNEPETFDLKKIGTFPIVHGARVLALEHRLDVLGTADRLQELAAKYAVAPALVRDLIDTLHFLMGMKLRNNLRQQSLGEPISNLVRFDTLGKLDRDALNDALAIIRMFKQHLRLRYRLD